MLPRVVIHNGVSVDGRMDGYGSNEWLYYQLAASWGAGAMLSGSNTMLAAFAQFEQAAHAAEDSVPGPQAQAEPGAEGQAQGEADDYSRQILAVVDSRGRIHNWRTIREQPYWGEVVVLCSQATPRAYIENLAAEGIAFIQCGEERVDLKAALEALYERYGVRLVRVDSGGILNGALLRAGLVDEFSLLISPNLAGGQSPSSVFWATDLALSQEAIPLRLVHCERLEGDYVWLKYELVKP
ncbi:MAG: RibD family protein [Anaerolineales bacterium]|nr:RibD family protein [Anaerolineales bacterium]